MFVSFSAAEAHQCQVPPDANHPEPSVTLPEQSSHRRPDATPSGRNQRELSLLARTAVHDSEAFKELYLLYHRRLARFLMRLTPRYDVAEEIINDTFWVVWQRAGTFRGASQVSTWIMGIAYRRGLKTLQRLRPMPAAEEGELENLPDESGEHAELNEWLGVALTRLPLEQQTVLELAYHLGHSCEEIAQIMQCPVNTVKTRMFHARRKLKGLLVTLAGPGQ
ncbi:MAG TPA: sigma-70 family RNA polymerase sigma factor [Steroidobacteraceae bacterium]